MGPVDSRLDWASRVAVREYWGTLAVCGPCCPRSARRVEPARRAGAPTDSAWVCPWSTGNSPVRWPASGVRWAFCQKCAIKSAVFLGLQPWAAWYPAWARLAFFRDHQTPVEAVAVVLSPAQAPGPERGRPSAAAWASLGGAPQSTAWAAAVWGVRAAGCSEPVAVGPGLGTSAAGPSAECSWAAPRHSQGGPVVQQPAASDTKLVWSPGGGSNPRLAAYRSG